MLCFTRKKISTKSIENDVEATYREDVAMNPLPAPAQHDPASQAHRDQLPTRYNQNRMHDAIKARDVHAVKELLSAGTSTAYLSNSTPLHLCISCYCYKFDFQEPLTANEREIFNAILAVAEEKDLVNNRDDSGATVIFSAIQSGNLEVVQALLRAGAEMTKIGSNNVTALYLAARHPAILKHILDNYDVENTQNICGCACIHYAVAWDQVESIKLLVERFGKEQLTWRCHHGVTVLHVAAGSGSVKALQFLIPLYPSDIYLVDDDGETPLYYSARQGHQTVTGLLLKNGAVLSDKGKNGKSVIRQMARKFDEPSTFLTDIFNECIYETTYDCWENRLYCIDYGILTRSDGTGRNQLKVVQELVNSEMRPLLMHPVIRSLLHLKMKLFLPIYYTMIALYIIFLALFNAFIFKFNNKDCDCYIYWVQVTLIYIFISLLLALEQDKTRSSVCSPLSAQSVLALTALGCAGASRAELLRAMDLTDDDAIRSLFGFLTSTLKIVDGVTLRIANRVYVKKSGTLKPAIKKDAEEVFDSVLEQLDFNENTAAADQINKWVAQQTGDMIKDLVRPDSLDADTGLVLVNAIYFQGKWVCQFSKESTKDGTFHVDGTTEIKVPMMRTDDKVYQYKHSPELKAKILRMYYEGRQASLVIVLPDELEGLGDVMQQLAAGHHLMDEIAALRNTKLDVMIPKFKVETEIDLTKLLPKMGIKSIFDKETSDIQMMMSNERLYVSKAVQKAVIEVNEEGTRAAAASYAGYRLCSKRSRPPKKYKFTADHPFLYLLMARGIPLFFGLYQGRDFAVPNSLNIVDPEPRTDA